MGLFRTAARASVATRVVGNTRRKQEKRWAAEDAAAAQAAAPQATPAAGVDNMITQLKQLGELRDAGVLTDEEFETQKARILATQ